MIPKEVKKAIVSYFRLLDINFRESETIEVTKNGIIVGDRIITISNYEREDIIKREYSPSIYDLVGNGVRKAIPEEGILVFETNAEGIYSNTEIEQLAYNEFGAVLGNPEGFRSRCYGLITHSTRDNLPVSIFYLEAQIDRLIVFARKYDKIKCYVTVHHSFLNVSEVKNLWVRLIQTIDVPDNIILPQYYDIREPIIKLNEETDNDKE